MVSDHLKIPLSVIPGILFFIAAQLFLHVMYALIIWILARACGHSLTLSWHATTQLAFTLWIIGLITILFANQLFFPNSKFADLTRTVFGDTFATIIFYIGCFIFLLTLLLIKRVAISLLILIPTIYFIPHYKKHHPITQPTFNHPNIFIIGIDGLRPDYLGFFDGTKKTKHLDQFLENAVVFSEALTPIARTFPAWISILTGDYPITTQARFDLIDPQRLTLPKTLPQLLKDQFGYKTIFAMDETRFSNIEKNMGFDQLITPKVGFNDFLLGTFNDFPLSNLIINTPLGKWLFPCSYANRPAFITYDPNSFLNLLKPELTKQQKKPLFLSVHFCLPHFPYLWAQYSTVKTTQAVPHYIAAVERADKQVGDFLKLLKQNGLLKNAIVVLLSDHGEALELSGDRITNAELFQSDHMTKAIPHFYPASFDFETVDQSAGHGTDVLGLTQYHSTLAFRWYGQTIKPKVVEGRVSLMDVKPTLLNLLNNSNQATDGTSLASIITSSSTYFSNHKHFFIESDFSPQSVRSVHPETKKLLFEGIDFFHIDPFSTKLTVKKEMEPIIISSKQYADIFEDWILALYPQAHGEYIPILVNLKTGIWTNDLQSNFAKNSPNKIMLHALEHFYRQKFILNNQNIYNI